MRTFTITDDNRISILDPEQTTSEVAHLFGNEAELARITAEFPAARLIAIWNSLPGAQPVKKFTDRKTAIARIWKAVQNLAPAPAAPVATGKARKAKSTKEAPAAKEPRTGRDSSKKAKVIKLLQRENGATLAEIMTVTRWQAHTIRGFISGSLTKKMGLKIESMKRSSGDRAYMVAK